MLCLTRIVVAIVACTTQTGRHYSQTDVILKVRSANVVPLCHIAM